jgi:hypothetical protein
MPVDVEFLLPSGETFGFFGYGCDAILFSSCLSWEERLLKFLQVALKSAFKSIL